MTLSVAVRCVACKAERKVFSGEVPHGEVPMCAKCFSPMVVVRAVAAS